MYLVMGMLFLLLVVKAVSRGPQTVDSERRN
jgi:hypothetical protein